MRTNNLIKVLLCITMVQLIKCERYDKKHILSRRRRYLTFPKGSSLQLGRYMWNNL